MIIVNKRSRLLIKMEDVYFAGDHKDYTTDADIVTFYQCSAEIPGSKVFNTLHIDISQEEEALFTAFDRRTRNDLIKSAKMDTFGTKTILSPDKAVTLRFINYFNSFAKAKGITPCDPELLNNLNSACALALSMAVDETGKWVCCHTHIFDNDRARALYSCSHLFETTDSETRNMTARANRALHWSDMMYFKNRGCSIYDFGGISLDKGDTALSRVSEFKMGFGGEMVTEYHFLLPKTLSGKLALVVSGRKNRHL